MSTASSRCLHHIKHPATVTVIGSSPRLPRMALRYGDRRGGETLAVASGGGLGPAAGGNDTGVRGQGTSRNLSAPTPPTPSSKREARPVSSAYGRLGRAPDRGQRSI